MADEDLWRRRFHLFVLIRLIGMATFALGVVIAYADLLRPGGWPIVGLIVAIVGAIDALFAPRMLKRVWEQQDRDRK
jgi:membrane protein implicated in regulation of membrane protease activity